MAAIIGDIKLVGTVKSYDKDSVTIVSAGSLIKVDRASLEKGHVYKVGEKITVTIPQKPEAPASGDVNTKQDNK